MNTLLIYMLKAALYLTVFYLLYAILLSSDTSYGRNRTFILLSLVSAMILPNFTLQNIKPLDIQFFGKFLSEVFITAAPDGTETLNSGLSAAAPVQIVYSIYIIGVIVLIFKLMVELLNILFLIVRGKNEGSRIIVFHGFNTAGFSAMGYIFINSRLATEEASEIIKHEQNHLNRNHFVDNIFVEIIKAFQWFNPVAYLFNRSLRAIHEYQADQECLTSGVPLVNYQNLLLNQVFKSNAFNLNNSFSNPSLIKKRMIMMTKKRTSSLASMKLIFVVPVIGVLFIIVSSFREINNQSINRTNINLNQGQTTSETASGELLPPPPPLPFAETTGNNTEGSNEIPYTSVEVMPEFPGGDAALLKYISENTTYPEIAKKNNIRGKIIVRFCVTAKGGITQVSVLHGADPELDAEAVRVVGTLPAFIPGKQNGKAVPVWYMVPITFALK